MTINYHERIPNNVNLAADRRLQRALEAWQPHYLRWWHDLGPEGTTHYDVYLRTAVDVGTDGWAHFDYVRMPEYRWGIFLAQPEADRLIAFGDHKGELAWQEVPGEYRSTLRRLIVDPDLLWTPFTSTARKRNGRPGRGVDCHPRRQLVLADIQMETGTRHAFGQTCRLFQQSLTELIEQLLRWNVGGARNEGSKHDEKGESGRRARGSLNDDPRP